MFLIFVAFSLACFVLGYVARRRGVIAESASRPLHLFTIIWLWAPVTLLAFWGLDPGTGADVATLMLSQPALMVGPAAVMAVTVMLLRRPREQRGVMTLAAALSNQGFALGAYLCYALLKPHEQALSYGIAYVTAMQVFMVLIFYPVAAHYSPMQGKGVGRLMVASFITPRAAPLYAAAIGFALHLSGITYPHDLVARSHVMPILFFAGSAGANIGIGLRFRFGDFRHAVPMHGLLAVMQFIVHPLMAAGLIALMGLAGHPPSDLTRHVLLIEATVPTALNTVIVSNLFHLDARLASSLWLSNTLMFCVFVLPIVLWMW